MHILLVVHKIQYAASTIETIEQILFFLWVTLYISLRNIKIDQY